MSLAENIEPEMIRRIAAKRHGLEVSWAEAEKIHEKIILTIGETLDREITELRNERQWEVPCP